MAKEAASNCGVRDQGEEIIQSLAQDRQAVTRWTTLYHDAIPSAPRLEEVRNLWDAHDSAKVLTRELLEEDQKFDRANTWAFCG